MSDNEHEFDEFDPDDEEQGCIGASCLHWDPFHLPSECFTVRVADELALLDVLVEALVDDGARALEVEKP